MSAIIGIYHNRTETTPDRRERLNDHRDPDTGELCGAFWGTCKLCYVSQVATYNREAVTFEDGAIDFLGTAEAVYAENQSGTLHSAGADNMLRRSLSVGDVVTINGVPYKCASIGFRPMTVEALNSAIVNVNTYNGRGVLH